MTYTVNRDKAEQLGRVFHVFLGTNEVAKLAVAKAKEAETEYANGLLALMDELGIDRSQINSIHIDWSGKVTVADPVNAQVAAVLA